MKRKNQWKKISAVMLSLALCIPGMTAYAASPEHDEFGGICDGFPILGPDEELDLMGSESFVVPDGTVNSAYSHRLSFESCGLTPVIWSLEEDSVLPSGLKLNTDGTLNGTPKVTGTYKFHVKLELGEKGKIASPSDAHPGYHGTNQQYVERDWPYQITIHAAKEEEPSSPDNGNDSSNSASDSSNSTSAASIQKTGWYLDAAADWYYYDSYNVLHKGWLLDPQDHFWYYLDRVTGKMYLGWNEIDGKWYYFNPESPIYTWEKRGDDWFFKGIEGSRPKGSMYSGEKTPDGHLVGEDGARID